MKSNLSSVVLPLLLIIFFIGCSSTPSSNSGEDPTPTPDPSLPSCHNTGCSAYVGQTLTDANGVNLGTVIAFKTQYIKMVSPTNYAYAIDYNGKFWLMGNIITDNMTINPVSNSDTHQWYSLGDEDGDFTIPVFQSWSNSNIANTDSGFCIQSNVGSLHINTSSSLSYFTTNPTKIGGNSHYVQMSDTGTQYSHNYDYTLAGGGAVITCTINDAGVFPANNSIKPILVAPDGTQILP